MKQLLHCIRDLSANVGDETEAYCTGGLGVKVHIYTDSRNFMFWRTSKWDAIEQVDGHVICV